MGRILWIFLLAVLVFGVAVQGVFAQDNEPSYAPKQVIVQFEKEYSPFELENELVMAQPEPTMTLWGVLMDFFSRILNTQKTSETESHLIAIEKADSQAGAVEKKPLFDVNSDTSVHTYLIVLDGTVPVEKAVEIYEALEETTYAQPNYIYSTQYETY